ncbi:Metallo-dependent hydrolase [Epithele typhae]|uniref:Metallo-dependent hydrolase n=1 Tax=Epithele typhae TaxID=378194 RepID=UPI002008BCC5|nr:Metallo-dependent hydrolase [Epithele typhae]KAH9928471.1 Metallo-dependent hydrolase [Epithele typhae]
MDAKYLEDRERLIAEDRALRIDTLALAQATDIEKRAEDIVRQIRADENERVWGPNAPELPGAQHIFPGMAFLTGSESFLAKETILKTKMFEIVSKMPKGGVLHVHLDATVDATTLLRIGLKYPAIHVRAPQRVTASSMLSTFPEFAPLPKSSWTSVASLTGPDYEPGTWVPLKSAMDVFDATLGGPEGFFKWACTGMTINPSEAYGTHNTTDKIWKRFGKTFEIQRGFTRYLPIWKDFVLALFRHAVSDGISYIEARVPFFFKYMFGEDGNETVPHREWLIAYDQVLAEFKEELVAQGRAEEWVGSKVIYSMRRTVTPEELEWFLEDCIALKREFPHLICGFDLVGHEDPLQPLIYYIDPLRRFVERQKEEGLDIPFIFHAGETLGDGLPADMNLYDAILLGTKRIGHGFSLVKHPKIMQVCREREILIEVCPISNEVLPDDPGMFGYMGVSFDFFQVLVASNVNGIITMRELAKDGLRFSCLEPEEKARALALYDKQWDAFVDWIVKTRAECA